MNPERWAQIESLYHAALEYAPEARAAFLDEACAGDETLRRQVAALLAQEEAAADFIAAPALDVAARVWAADLNEPTSLQPESGTVTDTARRQSAAVKLDEKTAPTAPGSIILVAIILTLMSIGIGVNSYYGISYFNTAGDPGWVIFLDGRVQTYGGVSGADITGLHNGDEVVVLDGQPYENFRQYFQTFARRTPGTSYAMVVRRAGQTQTLQLRTAAYHLWLRIFIVIELLVLPGTFLLIGLTIFLLRRDSKQARLLALLLGMMFAGGWPPFALFVVNLSGWLTALMAAAFLVGVAGVLPVMLHFFLIFPERSPLLHRFPRLTYFLYHFFLLSAFPPVAIAIIRLATAPERFISSLQDLLWPFVITVAIIIFYLGGALLSLVQNYRRGNQLSRRKLRVVLVGTLMAFLPTTLIRVALFILRPTPSMVTPRWLMLIAVGLVSFLIFPLSFAYAIARHQVIPVSLVIRRSLQYLLAKNALRVLLALPILGLVLTVYANRDRTLGDLLFHNSVWFYVALVAAVGCGLVYRRNLRDWLDRRFFREAYQQDKILRELTEDVRQLSSPTEMAQHVSRKVSDALHPEQLYHFYCADGRGDLLCGYSSGGASRDLRLPRDFELLRFMEYQGGAQDFPFPARTKLPQKEKDWLAALGASLIVPMRGTDDRLTGLLVLGPKKSEIPYTGSDRQLLETLADQMALHYENVLLKERVAQDRRVRHEVLSRLTAQQLNLLKECPQCGRCYDSTASICTKDQAELTLTLPVERTLEGKYQLERLLGKGGMGAVYEATDLRLGRRVAVKVITGRLFGDQAALRRFEREARASARLNHPNIIAVHDYGRAGAEGAYLVMELVVGETLRDVLKSNGTLPQTEAAAYFEQILAGLQAAHHAGVIHRDLKPENVFLARPEANSGEGTATIKLLDFGLAKLRTLDTADAGHPSSNHTLTTPGMVMGTFGYMSPEQLLGQEVDERTDIFAVGVMIAEALTGRRPFEGKSHAELLTAVLRQKFTLPGDTPAIRQLDAILQKCLAKERTNRYPNASVLQSELIPALKACPPLPSFAKLPDERDTALLPGN